MSMVETVARAMWEQRRANAAAEGIVLDEWGDDGLIPRLNGIFEEARVAIRAVHTKLNSLVVEGPLPGNGCDKQAERNGIIRACNFILIESVKGQKP